MYTKSFFSALSKKIIILILFLLLLLSAGYTFAAPGDGGGGTSGDQKIDASHDVSNSYLKDDITSISGNDKYRFLWDFEKQQIIDDAFTMIAITSDYIHMTGGAKPKI